MAATKAFFAPFFKVILFILATVWGAKILYSKVIFPGYNFLPFEIYNPILDLTKSRFLFRIIFLLWSLFLYFFMQVILSRIKWKALVIVKEKFKIKSFFKGTAMGLLFMGVILISLLALNLFKISKANTSLEDAASLLFGYFVAILATTFFLELIFRATALEIFEKYLKIHLANLIVSILFASLFIFSKSDFYPLKQLMLSIFLGYIYYKWGFYRAFGFHFGFDYLESFFFSNTAFDANLKRLTEFTPLTGLSLSSFVFLLIGTTWIALHLKKKKKKRLS